MMLFAKNSKILLSMAKHGQHLRNFNRLSRIIDVHPKVEECLQRRQPVVALESTIITHGMPRPQNLETAQEVEHIVRTNGALPATIAILDGRIKVGLTQEDLNKLASKGQEEVVKCSRRDLPYVLSQKQCGGTTVAATMIIAHMVGMRIFATGGVGGVHREGHITMDVSADLVELGRTPIAVVCSGVKSILDIPRTLEYLETQGVCVASYGEAQGRFPDFYTRDSGSKVPYNLETPKQAAQLIEALHDMDMQSGILIGVPIPEQYAADKNLIDAAIKQAYVEAVEQGVSGKRVTPFLLAAIAKITKGSSLQANIALIKNNAAVAAQIACELSHDKSYNMATASANTPLVIGASILDLSLTMLDDMPTKLNGATFQTKAKQSAGGVGRNLAEGIFKLYGKTNFISAVGKDQMGKSLLQLIPQQLRERILHDNGNATSLCSVIFDKTGDCKLILGNMEIHEKITADLVQQHENLFRLAPLIIIDGNLSVSTMECILKLAQKYERPVFFEPTDMRIAGKPFTLPSELTRQIKIISPNLYELKTIVEAITKESVSWEANLSTISIAELLQKTKELVNKIQNHFDCILVTLGQHGVLLSLRGDSKAFGSALFNTQTGSYALAKGEVKCHLKFYAAPSVPRVTNVSGAGDSFSSGFITGLLRGYEVERCIAMGFIAAERALQSESAVPVNYFTNACNEENSLQQTLKSLDKIEIQN